MNACGLQRAVRNRLSLTGATLGRLALCCEARRVHFGNSGAEAVEGAMKLAKRVTSRSKIICFNKSYHGSTQGALSLMGDEYWRNAFRPLLSDIHHFDYGSQEAIDAIDKEKIQIGDTFLPISDTYKKGFIIFLES